MGLGNFFQVTPTIKGIHKYFPGSKIDLFGGSPDGSDSIINGSPLVNKIYKFDIKWSFFKKIKFIISLKKIKYDFVFVPITDESGFLFKFMLLIGAKNYIINLLPNNNFRWKLFNSIIILIPKVKYVQYLPGRHEIDLHLDFLQTIIQIPLDRQYETLNIYDNSLIKPLSIKFKNITNNYIVIAPSARAGLNTPKLIPIPIINEIIDYYYRDGNFKIITIGTSGDYEWFENKVDMGKVVNIAGKTSIKEVAVIMKNAICNILPDSGSMHIAHSVKANIIAIYGPTDITRTKPIGQNVRILKSGKSTDNIMFNFKMSEVSVFDKYGATFCMDGIKINNIIDAVRTFTK
jgi:ADP-heptose:LPS heptosyltransferase